MVTTCGNSPRADGKNSKNFQKSLDKFNKICYNIITEKERN